MGLLPVKQHFYNYNSFNAQDTLSRAQQKKYTNLLRAVREETKR